MTTPAQDATITDAEYDAARIAARFAARRNLGVDKCPFSPHTPKGRALTLVFVRAYLRIAGVPEGAVSYEDDDE